MFSSTVPFRSGSVRVILIHGRNRAENSPGLVGTAMSGIIRLQSECEVRYSSLFDSYNYHFDIFGSWLAIHAQHASGNPSRVSYHSYHYDHSLYGWIFSW